MIPSMLIVAYHRDHFSFRRDCSSIKRWICFWRGHRYARKAATLAFKLEGRQQKWGINLPCCRRCGRLLDYSINIGARNASISEAKVTVS